MRSECLKNQATVEITVGDTMVAAFDGEVVHRVYGTASMVGHMEMAARLLVLDARDEGEEGIGYHVEVTHCAPAPVGTRVTIVATLHAVEGNRVVCDVEARSRHGIIGHGRVTQVVLPRELIDRRFARFAVEEPEAPHE